MSAVNRNLLFRLFIKESPAMSQEGMSQTTMSRGRTGLCAAAIIAFCSAKTKCYGVNGKTVDSLPDPSCRLTPDSTRAISEAANRRSIFRRCE
jgi:hypothetical protein